MRKNNICGDLVGNVSGYDKQHIRLTYITHFYLDQSNPNTVLDLFSKYETYSSDLLDEIQFIVVNDGSKLSFDIPDYNLNIKWIDIVDDIPWNQGGARNLGVMYAKSDKILLTDIDLEFPEKTLEHMVKRRNPRNKFYKTRINHVDRGFIGKGHPNVFFMSRARFLRFYGYDEEFSGGHGAEDYRFVKYQKYHGSWQKHLPKKFYCYRRNQNIDLEKSYHSLSRNHKRNTPIDKKKVNEILCWGSESGHSRLFLNFEWRIVKYSDRSNKMNRKEKLYWKHLWWFRTIFNIC